MDSPQINTASQLDPEHLTKILQEISGFHIDLEEDPTLPHLGARYLNQVLSKCRSYQNRVQYYMQLVKMHEKAVRLDLKTRELDFELKFKEKLADDPIVKTGPSVADRDALATMLLRAEADAIAAKKVELLDIEETYKMVKFKYDQLKQTSTDIKMQRTIVKDDKDLFGENGQGYNKPQANQDGSVEGGMRPAVRKKVDPMDLLDGTVPDTSMKPANDFEARLMADWLNKHPIKEDQVTLTAVCEVCGSSAILTVGHPISCPKGHIGTCKDCGKPQIQTPSGQICPNGHGGSQTIFKISGTASEPEPDEPQTKGLTAEDMFQ